MLNEGPGSAPTVVHICFDFSRLQCDQSCLAFQKNILDVVHEFPGTITCSLHVTKQTTQISAELKPYTTGESPKDTSQSLGGRLAHLSAVCIVGALMVGSCRLERCLPGDLGNVHHGIIMRSSVGFTYCMLISYCPCEK